MNRCTQDTQHCLLTIFQPPSSSIHRSWTNLKLHSEKHWGGAAAPPRPPPPWRRHCSPAFRIPLLLSRLICSEILSVKLICIPSDSPGIGFRFHLMFILFVCFNNLLKLLTSLTIHAKLHWIYWSDLLRWLDTVKKEMQHKPFDTPILCIFNLYSRNNDEYG